MKAFRWLCSLAALSVVAAEKATHLLHICGYSDNGCQKGMDYSTLSSEEQQELLESVQELPGLNIKNKQFEGNCGKLKVTFDTNQEEINALFDVVGRCVVKEQELSENVKQNSAMASLSSTQDASTIDDGWIITIYVTSFGSAAVSLTYFGYKAYKKFV